MQFWLTLKSAFLLQYLGIVNHIIMESQREELLVFLKQNVIRKILEEYYERAFLPSHKETVKIIIQHFNLGPTYLRNLLQIAQPVSR